MEDPCFIPFLTDDVASLIPNLFNDPFGGEVPEICEVAAKELQVYLNTNQQDWIHNFGLVAEKKTPLKGKMFGVLVVRTLKGELGYLATYSGKIQDNPHPDIFVPSIFDISSLDSFLGKGMTALSRLSKEINALDAEPNGKSLLRSNQLKEERKIRSIALQNQLFSNYQFLNQAGLEKGLVDIFKEYSGKLPASGAGDCAAPKLLQYALERKMTVLAIAEFWWGKTTKSEVKEHRHYYPACEEKCRPILEYMLQSSTT